MDFTDFSCISEPSAVNDLVERSRHTERAAGVFEAALDYSASLDENAVSLATMAATILDAENCSIILFREDGSQEIEPGVSTPFCDLPAVQQRSTADHAMVPNSVLAAGTEPRTARQGAAGDPKVMRSPISIDGKLLGRVEVSNPKSKSGFDAQDLALLQVLTLFISKSIQVVQLRNVLKSRFAQLALVHGSKNIASEALVKSAQQPEQMVKIVVKSFYREMARAGFSPRQIINAASGIIAELSQSLRRHSKRLEASERAD